MEGGKIYINVTDGNLKIIRSKGRLVFPLEVIETKTLLRREVKSTFELARLIKRIRMHRHLDAKQEKNK